MEERGNQTVMCSVLFLDIVEYSRKSVAGQISLKERFNSFLSAAISDVPITDRIILDTGDGAAINFLGDVEDALKAALSVRESLLNEDVDLNHPLLVRMGINLGPVRLVRDINGQPNIVGDGINVAQRVMSFADASQILVSRSYYDAVSRLSPHYAGMFHYQGSRTDKHVREHEVYAIGYPGDKTTQRGATRRLAAIKAESQLANVLESAIKYWRLSASRLDDLIVLLATSFRQAEPQQRAVYVGVAAIPLLLLIVLSVKLAHRDVVPIKTDAPHNQTIAATQPESAVAIVVPGNTGDRAGNLGKPQATITDKQNVIKKKVVKLKAKPKLKPPAINTKTKSQQVVTKKDAVPSSAGTQNGFVKVACIKGTEVFVDGVRKGRIGSSSLTIAILRGKHSVIVSHPSEGVYSQEVMIEPEKVVRLDPPFCNK